MIVAIGASAGGLNACRRLLAVLPADTGMAFVIVQHLDPTRGSLLVELLASHTGMTVEQAASGMPILANHVYVIPPGGYLSVSGNALQISVPDAPHGARLPFDFLLQSLAKSRGARTVCVVLSGTGADGSAGLKAVKAAGGLVIAETPEDAEYDGMPRSAVLTGDVDMILPIDDMPRAIAEAARRMPAQKAGAPVQDPGHFAAIIELLRAKTAHDFTLYKPGTLERRIARRMVIAGVAKNDPGQYLGILRRDQHELELLANDLLINVTSFFRDPAVFDELAKDIIPDLVRGHAQDQTIRIWMPGCSSGEETYSLAMLFCEEITASGLSIRLQIFATDVDADAVAAGREGVYPASIEKEVSAARLARFFIKEGAQYRISAELRSMIVFTVQDLLADPPFSRLNMISCRNLLIYLRPEAQSRVVALFHFALRQGGLLLLGSSETLTDIAGRFEIISPSARLFRHIGRIRPGELGFSHIVGDGVRVSLRAGGHSLPLRQTVVAELCRRIVLENYAPAAVLINQKHECLFSLGPLDRYLRVPQGHPTHDMLAMVRPGLRTKLRASMQRAWQENVRVTEPGGRISHGTGFLQFGIDVHPVLHDGEKLLLICFVDAPASAPGNAKKSTTAASSTVAELGHELEAARAELRAAIRNLEQSNEEQAAVNEEALSVNEEFQSTNEELLTSKEELQSLNEELTALNVQLQETLERQRTTANDLQNVLYSTDVATLFLDRKLHIRFFTPATKSLFRVIPTDIGRPLADLKSLAVDAALLEDARAVMASGTPLEHEVEAENARWYLRRALPYRSQENDVEGVVITFADITERRLATQAVDAARREAETANRAKSRFLAAASHDLRQPLQALTLLQGLLAKTVEGEAALRLVGLLNPTLIAMTTMLNTLLDINQIDAGTVRADITDVAVGPLLERLGRELTVVARASGLELRVVPCNHHVLSDPRLLEQMLRNLLSNAIKYTKHGRVLLGCRHRAGMLSIEVWDTGIGIAAADLQAIFEEYYQLDNPARERGRGLGLGLSIVKRLGDLLGHRVHVRSNQGSGSVFAIEAAMIAPVTAGAPQAQSAGSAPYAKPLPPGHRRASVLIIEDDPDLRDLLDLVLTADGHTATVASTGEEALALVARGKVRPELILADYHLPLAMNGLELATKLRDRLHHKVPVIILTGDISTDVLRDISAQDCMQMIKPVQPDELTGLIQHLLPPPALAQPPPSAAALGEALGAPVIYVVDDDQAVRATIRQLLESAGHAVEDYPSCEAFLAKFQPGREACLLVDAYLPGMHGIDLLQHLHDAGQTLPSVMITGDSDVAMALQAMKLGAMDLLEKPVAADQLLESVDHALDLARNAGKQTARQHSAADHLSELTARQQQIMAMVLAGQPSKNIAADLGISQRTVENHRAAIMQKTGAKSLPALARLALAAAWQDPRAKI